MIEINELLNRLTDCQVACQKCSHECLSATEDLPQMVECIRLCHDCSEACYLTINFISRDSRFVDDMISLCEELCRECAEACEKHEHAHCQKCASACRKCQEACELMET